MLRALTGTVGRRPIAHVEAPPLDTAIPRELAGDPVAISAWTQAIQPAIEAGIITGLDRCLAIGYCTVWSRWQSLLADPHQAGGLRTLAIFLRIASELGLTPIGRLRIQPVERPRKDNPLSKYLVPLKA